MYIQDFVIVIISLLALDTWVVEGLTPSQEQTIDKFVESLFPCYNPVGVSLAIVRHGQTELTKGYGTLAPEKSASVTSETRFCIGSCTKAFTSTLLGMLIAENRSISWDTKIKDILGSSFQLGDADVTRLVNLRDLLAHKTGMSRHDVSWLFGAVDRESYLHKLRFFKPYKEFRSTFVYNNFMYAVAGRVAEILGGKSYENLVRERIFKPLGMKDGTFLHEENNTMIDMAKPFIYVKQLNQTMEIQKEMLNTIKTVSSAGSICASAEDMAKWMNFHLNLDKNVNKTEEQRFILETRKPEMVLSAIFERYFVRRPDYPVTWSLDKSGLGWNVGYYRGYPLVSHGGELLTYKTRTSIIPSLGIGVYVSATGITLNDFLQKITMFVIDVLLEEEPWLNVTNSCSLKLPPEKLVEKIIESANSSALSFGKSIRPERDYYGTFGNLGYGNITVSAFANNPNPNITILHMHFGLVGNFTLTSTTKADTFMLSGIGKAWFIGQQFGQVVFSSSNNGTIIDRLKPSGFDLEHPSFIRGLKVPSQSDNDGGTPNPCTPPTPSSGEKIIFGLWVLIAVSIGYTCML